MRRDEQRRRKLTDLHLQRRFNQGTLLNPDGRGFGANGLKPDAWVAMAVKLDGDRIITARFVSSLDPRLKACASLLTDLVVGHTVDEVFEIEPVPLWEMLWLDVDDIGFMIMAIQALRNAIGDVVYRTFSPPLRMPRRLQ